MNQQWLKWAREIQALAQTSVHYTENEYQRERGMRLMEIAAEIMSAHTSLEAPELVEDFNDGSQIAEGPAAGE